MKARILLVIGFGILTSLLLLAQTGTVEQAFPLLFHGGTINANGDIRWESLLYATNIASTAGTAAINFLKADGSPQPVSLNAGPEQSTHTLTIPGGMTRIYRMTSAYPQINVFWGRAQVSSGVRLTGDFLLYGTNGIANDALISFARQIGSASFKSREMTISPVLLGAVTEMTQREVVLAAANPGVTPADVTATLFDNDHNQQGTISFTIPAGGQVFRFLAGDFQRTLEGGRVEIVSSQDIYVAALQFLNQFFSTIDIANGTHHPNMAPMVNVESPTNAKVFTVSAVTLSGWGFDPDGSISKLEYSVDGGAYNEVQFTVDRPDVKAAFSAAPLKSGFSINLSLANGSHTVSVRMTDNLGAITEQSRSFSVNRPVIVPQDGDYEGWSDDAQSTPAGTRVFWNMTISGGRITYLSALHIYMICNGVQKDGGMKIVGSSLLPTLAITDGHFVLGPQQGWICENLMGEFMNSTSAKISYSRDNQGTCWATSFRDCPSISTFAPNVVKVR